MQIKHVRIENFKRFAKLDIDLKPLDCLVGPNNIGKTTLLQALALFDFCLHQCLSSKNGQLQLKSRSISPEEFYILPVASPLDLWTDRKQQTGGRHRFIKVAVSFTEGTEVIAHVELNFNRFGILIGCEDMSQDWLKKLVAVRISYLPVFSMFLPQEERRTPAVIEDALVQGRINSVIRNLLLNLKRDNRDGELVHILQRVFPTLSKMRIEFDEVNDRYISVTYLEQDRPKELDVFAAGSGFQQFLYLFGFILLRQPTIVLLDEPDVHLHGTLQRALLEELRKLAARGKQILLATHSRELISQMNPDNIVVLDEKEARRLSVAFDIYDTLDRLGSVELSQVTVIQVYQRILVVENRSDWDLLSVFCSRILGTSIWQQVERRLAICYARGNPWKQDMARLRQQLQEMLTVTGQLLKMFVVADRDYHPDLEFLYKDVPSEHIEWHIWERAEIENYLLSLDGIKQVLASPQRQVTLEEASLETEFERLIGESYNPVNDKLVKAFQEYGRSLKEQWDAATLSKKAREYLQQHWENEKLALADAKEIVLPQIKAWLKSKNLGQFSNKSLAMVLQTEDFPGEVHELARRLAKFAGVESE